MKLIVGTEWKDSIRTNTREENLEILFKVNDAMAFAHSKGIVHRDLKPANTMIGPYGEVYVTDWGMAIDTKKNMRFGPGGSPAYMAPEMALHQIDKIGKASDIYILGAILFQIITGMPPHPGRSVQDTLRNAARNKILEHSSEDALLPIALKAMATKIEDRYQSVDEFQEALRQYRQHSESINLANASQEMLNEAVLGKDYELFSQAVFGYRNAVKLWPANEAAVNGARCAQLEYGRCAVSKGDFDLAMQVLDRSHADQALVYQQAVQGKQQIIDREKRVKNLRKIVAAVVITGTVLSSGFGAYAWIQKGRAEVNEGKAVAATVKLEKANDDLEQKQADLAKANETLEIKNEALDKANEDLKTTITKLNKANDDVKASNMALTMTRDELKVTNESLEKTNEDLKTQTNNAIMARDQARRSELAAKLAAGQTKLEEFKSALPLAKSQIESYDARAARKTLDSSKDLDPKSEVFTALAKDGIIQKPKSDTWPWQRVNLLSNTDLPQAQLDGGATAADYAPALNLGVVGTNKGKVHILSYANGKLSELYSHTEPGCTIAGVAISPKGDEVVFNVRQPDNSSRFCVWRISAQGKIAEPQPIQAAAKYSLQGFAYSQDGSYLVAGINQGIWLWKRTDKWYERKADNHYEKIRGRLNTINLIDDNHALVAAQTTGDPNESLTLYTVDLQDQNSSKKVILPEDWETMITAANYDRLSKQLVLGTTLGDLLAANLQARADNSSSTNGTKLTSTKQTGSGKSLPTQYVENVKKIQPVIHKTAIRKIISNDSGQLLTSGVEPVVHVWSRDVETGWAYETNLTGTANLAEAVFVGKGTVLGIDEDGLSMIWDIQRQKQRRRLNRVQADGLSPEKYASPIIGVFPSSNGQALAVNSKGMIERWDINTGATIPFGTERWVYSGHTPGAEFVDVAVDPASGIVATAAKLTNVDRLYRKPGEGDWEFCIWDQATGIMRRRWRPTLEELAEGSTEQLTKEKGVVEQRLSIVDGGRALIAASDSVTRLFSVEGKELFVAKNFGTYFAVPNPQATNELMLVMRTGAVAILDLKKLDAWSSAPRDLALTTISDTPQQGVWAPDGQSFYLTFNSGAVAAFDWDGSNLKLTWSSHRLDGSRDTIELDRALSSNATRVKSHADIDMAVRVVGESRRLYVARRVRGTPGKTDLTCSSSKKVALSNWIRRVKKRRRASTGWTMWPPILV